MQTRRDFLRVAGGTAALLTAGGVPPLFAKSTPQSTLVLDAMGEIRDVYGPELIGEILASGLNGIAVTLCDPKTYERDAWDAAMGGSMAVVEVGDE